MKGRYWLIVLGLVLAGCGQSESGRSESDRSESDRSSLELVTKGQAAPAFEFEDLSGKKVALNEYQGQKVVIKLWASWCGICLSGLEEAEEIAMDEQKDYQLLTVVTPNYKNEQTQSAFTEWFESLTYPSLPVLFDEEAQLIQQLGVRAYPTYVYIDTKGRLAQVLPGHAARSQIEETVAELP